MPEYEHIEGIKKIGETLADKQSQKANGDYFESLMQQQRQEASTTLQKADQISTQTQQRPSLIDEVKEISGSRKETVVTPAELVSRSQELIAQVETIKQKLQTPNLEIQGSVQNLLHNKLTHIDDSLNVALARTGAEFQSDPAAKAAQHSPNPIERFLGFLTDGQSKLQTIGREVEALHLNRQTLTPVGMLAVQIKVGYIQQELEFFTSLLNKALESTKTIMNVQV